uniref:Putative zinc finger protein n=1 Tax=Ixodes ricinus TaxID=34613 RepID=A0A0K8R5Y9_IXORI
MLVLELFVTMGNQVVHDPTLISGDIGTGTTPKADALSGFQWAAGLSQKVQLPLQDLRTGSVPLELLAVIRFVSRHGRSGRRDGTT